MALPGAPEVAYRGDSLHVEDLAVGELARRFGTPLYAYSHGGHGARPRPPTSGRSPAATT